MNHELLIEQFFETLINGDRHGSRQIMQHALNDAEKPEHVITDLLWPAYEKIDNLHRHDQLSHLGFNFATRLLRMLVDQNAGGYEIPAPTRRSVFAACGPNDADELGEIVVGVASGIGLDRIYGIYRIRDNGTDSLEAAEGVVGKCICFDRINRINGIQDFRGHSTEGVVEELGGLAFEVGLTG